MSRAPDPMAIWEVRARRRSIASVALLAVPPALALLVASAHLGGLRIAAIIAPVLVAIVALLLWRAARRDQRTAIVRRLDALAPQLEDSADLLWQAQLAPGTLAQLQRARLLARLANLDVEVREPWPRSGLIASALASALVLGLAWAWPRQVAPVAQSVNDATNTAASASRIEAARLTIQAPAYTRLPARSETTLDAKVAQDARLDWDLRITPMPAAVRLSFHDGSALDLQREGDHWLGSRVLAASTLYRIEVEGVPALSDELHRIDVRADRAPSIRVIAPEHTLNLHSEQQRDWPLEFAVDDDHGIAKAELVLAQARGSGEGIAFSEQTIALQPQTGNAMTNATDPTQHGVTLRYRHVIDLVALGFASDSELIARLVVNDNREPSANVARSASLILRWPAKPATDGSGVEGLAQQTLPAYFRSQRQIIIDTQALIAQKPELGAEAFLQRSDAIGVDQKILRLRYGQFLGEESEGHAEAALESGQAAADSQLGALAGMHGADEHAPATGNKADAAAEVAAEYGHVHDIAEASTLLDPQTRATLKAALDQMWQAELQLRQGEPTQALPFEQSALDFIKQAQQATRIYLARVGLELPVPDEKRRLSGERGDLSDRIGAPIARSDAADPLTNLWTALGSGQTPDWTTARQALLAHEGDSAQQLDALAALDRAQRESQCAACRVRLRAALWPLLPQPAAQVLPRPAPDAAARAYLDALQAARGGRR